MKIRQMLTVVLLEVTNQEIENVAMEAIEEAKSKNSFMHYVLCTLYILASNVSRSKQHVHIISIHLYTYMCVHVPRAF